MKKFAAVAVLLFASIVPGLAGAAPDLLRSALEESRATGKGLNLYVNGQAIAAVVVGIEDGYVVAKSQALGTIVVRLERIDGVAGFIAPPAAERKGQ